MTTLIKSFEEQDYAKTEITPVEVKRITDCIGYIKTDILPIFDRGHYKPEYRSHGLKDLSRIQLSLATISTHSEGSEYRTSLCRAYEKYFADDYCNHIILSEFISICQNLEFAASFVLGYSSGEYKEFKGKFKTVNTLTTYFGSDFNSPTHFHSKYYVYISCLDGHEATV